LTSRNLTVALAERGPVIDEGRAGWEVGTVIDGGVGMSGGGPDHVNAADRAGGGIEHAGGEGKRGTLAGSGYLGSQRPPAKPEA